MANPFLFLFATFKGNICSIVGVLLGVASIAFAIYTYVRSKKEKVSRLSAADGSLSFEA